MDILESLREMGYKISHVSNGWARTRPLYRDSDSDDALSINLSSGHCRDFVLARSFSFKTLVKMTKRIDSEDAEDWIKQLKVEFREDDPKREMNHRENPLPKSMIYNLEGDHSYWNNRGISSSVLKNFDSGVCREGEMKDRYVFRIYSSRHRIIGLDGRDLINRENSKRAKWKKIGKQKDWYFPRFNEAELENKDIILVESIGDMLSLMECGIYNCIPCFTIHMNTTILLNLVRLNPKRIIISFNNDKNGRGQEAMLKTKNRLDNLFSNVLIKIPSMNDYNEILTKIGSGQIKKELSNV